MGGQISKALFWLTSAHGRLFGWALIWVGAIWVGALIWVGAYLGGRLFGWALNRVIFCVPGERQMK